VQDFKAVKASGVSAVLHKASQGLVVDPSYGSHRAQAALADLLGGAYHFGVASQDPVAQADFFLKTVLANKNPLVGQVAKPGVLALDWEWNKADTMQPLYAAAFIQRIFHQTGRWPILYTSSAFLEGFPLLAPDGVFAQCELWLTGFTKGPNVPPPWSNWRIWQHGIGTCTGISGQVDRDTFNGTPAELESFFGS
jgi:lysozyme